MALVRQFIHLINARLPQLFRHRRIRRFRRSRKLRSWAGFFTRFLYIFFPANGGLGGLQRGFSRAGSNAKKLILFAHFCRGEVALQAFPPFWSQRSAARSFHLFYGRRNNAARVFVVHDSAVVPALLIFFLVIG